MKLTKLFLFVFLTAVIVVSCRKDDEPDDIFDPEKSDILKPGNEIRAAWVTTLYNLDWPVTKNNAAAQKAELIAILNHNEALHFNAVILQVRPLADAFHISSLEPWSQFLTGTQGNDPGYDPLQFALEEAHKRGMELHAWLNPYRIGPVSYSLAPGHVALAHPDWVVTFNDTRYFNPGIPEVIDHLKNVVKEIITRYDVDAIHFDDYFYPSGAKSTSNPFGFNDKTAWEKYGQGKDIHIWRAENVSKMVSGVSQLIRSTKPGVLFGISPSGRRENSLDLYADPLEWLTNHWVDYLAPQIYWEFGHSVADFGTLANYWNSNARGVPIIIGIAAYKFKDATYPAYSTVDQIGRQIDQVRNSTNLSGCFFFRHKFLENSELNAFLKTKYPYQSVLPFMGTTSPAAPAPPVIAMLGNRIVWQTMPNAVKYAVYVLEKDPAEKNTFDALCIRISSETQYPGEPGKSYFVTAVSRENAESAPSNVIRTE